MPLNTEQLAARALILDWLAGKRNHILIQGSPGTGKTYVVSHVLEEIDLDSIRLAVACPSHKAKNVAREYLESVGLSRIPCFTVHGLLGIGMDIDDSSGQTSFTSTASNSAPIQQFTHLWVDECSMLGKDLRDELFSRAVRLLFTGDRRQLLPIDEKSFAVFDFFESCPDNVATLEKPERYQGPIKDLVYAAIPYIDREEYFDPTFYLMSENCRLNGDWFTDWQKNDNEKVVLAFKNNTVTKINQMCRASIYGENPKPLYIGEELISYAPIKSVANKDLLPNGSTIIVSDIEEGTFLARHETFKVTKVLPEGMLEPCQMFLNKFEQKRWDIWLKELGLKCATGKERWRTFYYYKGLIADLRPTNALTIHKSQGSGWNSVYVIEDFSFLRDDPMQPRLHYVASSRAKEKLTYSARI